MQTLDDNREAVRALVTRWVTGEFSQAVFEASLRRYLDNDEIRHLVMLNQTAHRNSLAYRRGDVT